MGWYKFTPAFDTDGIFKVEPPISGVTGARPHPCPLLLNTLEYIPEVDGLAIIIQSLLLITEHRCQ